MLCAEKKNKPKIELPRWLLIPYFLNKKVQRKRISNRIGPIEDENGVIHTEDSAKAGIINDFFASVGSNLAKNLPEVEHQNFQFITRVTPSLGKIDVDEEYLKKQLRKIKPEKASGPDNVKARDISMIGNSLLDGLQGLFGRVIINKKLPLDWKCAKLKASFKKGDSKKSENYRPLSMLSVVSKMFEGQVCRPIDSHAAEHKLYHDKQWGYAEGRSTETLLLLLTEKWKQHLDQGKIVGSLFIDFRKAFDSVDHRILLEKLQAIGISGDIYELVENYLNDRKQFTEINGSRSDSKGISYGVPQGSLLGPRLFKIFINDLPNVVENGLLYMYADDTTAYCVGDNVDQVVDGLNQITTRLHSWCLENRLTINTEKTEAMILSRKHFIGPLKQLSLGENNIEFVAETKCLGVTIDKALKWNKQVKRVVNDFSAKLSQLKRLKFLSKKVLEEIYYKSIVPCVVYSLSVWGTCSKTLFNEIEKMHERAAKLIYEVHSCKDPLTAVGWKPLEHIYKRRIAILMYDIYNERVPNELQGEFKKNLFGRGQEKLTMEIPRPRTEIGRNSVKYRGPLIWNLLTTETRACKTKDTFKTKLKECKLDMISFQREAAIGTNKKKDYMYY